MFIHNLLPKHQTGLHKIRTSNVAFNLLNIKHLVEEQKALRIIGECLLICGYFAF